MRSAIGCVAFLVLACSVFSAERDVVLRTNTIVRIMASNMNGDSQTIEPFEIRIFQGLKPDIVAIQEFKYLTSTPNDFRNLLNTAFGTNYTYYREVGSNTTYSIPNGIISRYPIRDAGTWDDPDIPDRGFAWAQIDLPGDIDLRVVSMHLKASSSSSATRAHEAAVLKGLIASNFPANAWIVLAGDSNISDRNETALATFKTFLSDDPIPADDKNNQNTNEPRSKPYDLVLVSPTFRTNLVPAQVGSRSFPNGLVFDSRVFTELSAVAPVQPADSGNGQHMAVLKDFRINYTLTNRVNVPAPDLTLTPANGLSWPAIAGITYTLEATSNFVTWSTAGQWTAMSNSILQTNLVRTNGMGFFRVTF